MQNNLQQMHLKLLQKERFKKQQKEQVICYKIIDAVAKWYDGKITKVSTASTENNLKTVETGTENTWFERKIPNERYISPEKRQQIIKDLRLM